MEQLSGLDISCFSLPVLVLDEVLGYFGGDRTAYRDFVEEGMLLMEKPLEKGRGHGIVGDRAFIEEVLKQVAIRPTREQPAGRRAVGQVQPKKVLKAVTKRFVGEASRRYCGPDAEAPRDASP